MKKVLIVCGFRGIPNGGWLPWLMKELEKDFVYASTVPLKNTREPVISEWVEDISQSIGKHTEEIYLVGHSLGASAIFYYLKSLEEGKKVAGVILVSGPFKPIDTENPESVFRKIDDFLTPILDFKLVKNKAEKFIVVHGEKDKIVPISHAEKISSDLGCELVVVKGGDHFTQVAEPRTYELPPVLEALKKMF